MPLASTRHGGSVAVILDGVSPRRAVTVAAALAAVASVSARCTAVSPRVTIVALARDGVADPPYPAGEVVSESGVHPSPCAEWILNPSSQGYWELEVHAVTTQPPAKGSRQRCARCPASSACQYSL